MLLRMTGTITLAQASRSLSRRTNRVGRTNTMLLTTPALVSVTVRTRIALGKVPPCPKRMVTFTVRMEMGVKVLMARLTPR